MLGFPPYARVVMFRADALSLQQATDKLDEIKLCLSACTSPHEVKCIGPMPALMDGSGRSGRGDQAGEAYLQTDFPTHPLMQALANQDYQKIADTITRERKMLGFPPYARVVMFRADALSLQQATEKLDEIKLCLAACTSRHEVKCIGPMPALMTRRIGRYRAQLCLISPDTRKLRSVLREAMPEIELVKSTQKVNWVVDVDALDL